MMRCGGHSHFLPAAGLSEVISLEIKKKGFRWRENQSNELHFSLV